VTDDRLGRTDPVTLEILKNYFVAVAESMAFTLERTAHTTFVKESADFTTGVATPDGEFFCYPRHLGVSTFLGLNLKAAIDAAGDYQPGDVVFTNDPYSTMGLVTHLPDIQMFKPIFVDGEILCFAWCFIHCSDVGGLVPASISPKATEIQQEGFRIPPCKLYRQGVLNQELVDLFLANCRIPSQNWGDLQAMIAVVDTGERRMLEICGKFGRSVVKAAADDLLAWTEERARRVFATIPAGSYEFADYLDDDMEGHPVRLAVKLTARGGEVELDYGGTDPQVHAALNLPAFGERHPFAAEGLINFVFTEDPGTPLTGGLMRAVRIRAPKGTIMNPRFPAAVGVRYACVIRLYHVVLGALAMAVPERVPAAGGEQGCIVVLSTPDTERGGRRVSVLEPLNGGGGATLQTDGAGGMGTANGSLRNTPIESIEAHIPVVIQRYELLPDSGGAGRTRGGWGLQLDFRVLVPNSIVTARNMERCRFEPWGLAGGRASQTTRVWVSRSGRPAEEIGKFDVLTLNPGDVVSLRATGGGGYGSPTERDPALVAADVRSGLLSRECALSDYGVATDGQGVDHDATRRARSAGGRERSRLVDKDLGPSRREYESTWGPDASAALADLLLGVSSGYQNYLKRLIHEEVAAQRLVGLGRAQILDVWRRLMGDGSSTSGDAMRAEMERAMQRSIAPPAGKDD
jgi:N-methylhydantoinase B